MVLSAVLSVPRTAGPIDPDWGFPWGFYGYIGGNWPGAKMGPMILWGGLILDLVFWITVAFVIVFSFSRLVKK